MPSSNPVGGGSVAAAMAARSRRSKSVTVHRPSRGTGAQVAWFTGNLAQSRQPACGLAFDGAHAAAQRRRRLGLGEVLEVPQHQDGSLPGGKRSQAAQQEIPVCDRRGGVRGARIGSGGSASLITNLTGLPA